MPCRHSTLIHKSIVIDNDIDIVSVIISSVIRDWSLITGRGGATKREGGGGGTRSFTPTKRGGGKSFSHSEGGGHKKFWGSFYVVA